MKAEFRSVSSVLQKDTLTRTSCGDVLDARIREKSLSKVTL